METPDAATTEGREPSPSARENDEAARCDVEPAEAEETELSPADSAADEAAKAQMLEIEREIALELERLDEHEKGVSSSIAQISRRLLEYYPLWSERKRRQDPDRPLKLRDLLQDVGGSAAVARERVLRAGLKVEWIRQQLPSLAETPFSWIRDGLQGLVTCQIDSGDLIAWKPILDDPDAKAANDGAAPPEVDEVAETGDANPPEDIHAHVVERSKTLAGAQSKVEFQGAVKDLTPKVKRKKKQAPPNVSPEAPPTRESTPMPVARPKTPPKAKAAEDGDDAEPVATQDTPEAPADAAADAPSSAPDPKSETGQGVAANETDAEASADPAAHASDVSPELAALAEIDTRIGGVLDQLEQAVSDLAGSSAEREDRMACAKSTVARLEKIKSKLWSKVVLS